MTAAKEWLYERVRGGTPLWVGAAVSIALFLFGIRLLGTTTEVASVSLDLLFDRYVGSDGRALGVSWLTTYAMANGSVVAALSVSLYAAGILTGGQLFLMVDGSRLGRRDGPQTRAGPGRRGQVASVEWTKGYVPTPDGSITYGRRCRRRNGPRDRCRRWFGTGG